jgi:hypothetical protein
MATKTNNMPLRSFFGHADIAYKNLALAKKHIEEVEAFCSAIRSLFPDLTLEEIVSEVKRFKEAAN